MKDFVGKVAVITGAASGIGFALAECFSREGMQLVLADIEDAALQNAVAQLRGTGVDVVGVRTDVSRFEDVVALEQQAVEAFGKVHVLCNIAGVLITGPTWKLSLDDWRWVMDVNVNGAIFGAKVFLPGMLAHGEPAHILNSGSLSSFQGIGEHAPYSVSKFAVLGLSQALYSELKSSAKNVGISILCPGPVATDINRSWRNRPQDHLPWSDREFADGDFMAFIDTLQKAGIPPALVAERAIDAIRNDKFYVFTNGGSKEFIAGTAGRAQIGENPYVMTWGNDVRSDAEKEIPSWSIEGT